MNYLGVDRTSIPTTTSRSTSSQSPKKCHVTYWGLVIFLIICSMTDLASCQQTQQGSSPKPGLAGSSVIVEPADKNVKKGEEGDKCNKTEICSRGILLPVWLPNPAISKGDIAARAIVYLVCLMYMFVGVSIIADRFMSAIEVITSKERQVTVTRSDGRKQVITVRVWNETVSNLTLMALGSSAPEILLSIIEICGSGFKAGDMGPGTIVGSAAFNLFIIVGLCAYIVPSDEIRRVKHIAVFWVTAAWSLFAYIWLYLIIAVITPGRVDWWEGTLTFLFFPLTVVTGYMADKKVFSFGRFGQEWYMGAAKRGNFSRPTTAQVHSQAENGVTVVDGKKGIGMDMDPTPDEAEFERHRAEYMDAFKKLRIENPDADLETLATMAEKEVIRRGPKSRAFYRIQATRKLVGAGDIMNKIPHVALDIGTRRDTKGNLIFEGDPFVKVFFEPSHYTCLENVGTVYVTVNCIRGSIKTPCKVFVDYTTEDGTANAPSDYITTEGTLEFGPNEDKKVIGVDIIDNDIYEEDEHFYVQLTSVRVGPPGFKKASQSTVQNLPAAKLVTPSKATVMIVDNDHAGQFQLELEEVKVSEACGEAVLKIVRSRGARGDVVIPYYTVEGSARENLDYIGTKGKAFFADEQTEVTIKIPIINTDKYEKSSYFHVEIQDPIWDNEIVGRDRSALSTEEKKAVDEGKPFLGQIVRCTISVIENKEFKSFIDRMAKGSNTAVVVGTSTWKQQFLDAIALNGGDDDGSDGPPGCMDRVMHAVTLPWKLVFAFLPPTDYLGGWACFVASIAVIGLMTALIGDLASHFGCTIGLKQSVTAISLVALGTSLPDTFASKVAAIQDEHADACIVNVTGSNAVNVFLGIGIAWMIAAIYHNSKGNYFYVTEGSLAFSVTLFCVGAVLCIIILQFRRYHRPIKGELGGNYPYKLVTLIVFLSIWLMYVILASLEAYCVIPGF